MIEDLFQYIHLNKFTRIEEKVRYPLIYSIIVISLNSN